MNKPNLQICNECLFKDQVYIEPLFIDKQCSKTIAIIGDVISNQEVKYGKPFSDYTNKPLRYMVKQINTYNILYLNAVLCHPIKNNQLPLKVVNQCSNNILKFIQQYNITRFLILGKNALNSFERIFKLKHDLPIEQLDKKGILSFNYNGREMKYRVTYHPGIYIKTKYNSFIESIKQAVEDIFETSIEYTDLIEEKITTIQNELQNIPKTKINLDIDANGYDLILVNQGNNKFYYTFYKDGKKKILQFYPLTLINQDNFIKPLNFINFTNYKKEDLLFTNENAYSKNLKNLLSEYPVFSVYALDGRTILNHYAITINFIKNNQFNTYPVTYIDIELVNDKIVLATIIHNNKIILFTEKKVETDTANEIIVTNDIATDVNQFLKENVVIVGGWNVYFDIIEILKRAKNIEIDDLEYDFDSNHCNYPYYAIFDLLTLYKFYINPNSFKYSLDYVAKQELGKSKILTSETFEDLYNNNYSKFVEYNILDTILVKEIDEKYDISNLVQEIRIATEFILKPKLLSASYIGAFILYKEAIKRGLFPSISNTIGNTDLKLSGAFVQETKPMVITNK